MQGLLLQARLSGWVNMALVEFISKSVLKALEDKFRFTDWWGPRLYLLEMSVHVEVA